MFLGRPAVEDGVALQTRQGAAVGLGAVVGVGPTPDVKREQGLDLGAALGEQLPQLRPDAGDVGMAVDNRVPADAEAGGELGAEGGVVDPADGALLVLEKARVEGEPAATAVLHLGPDEGVRVQLGIDAAAGVLAEQRHGQALGVDLVHAVGADAGDRAVALEPAERRGDRGVVGGEHLGPHPGIG